MLILLCDIFVGNCGHTCLVMLPGGIRMNKCLNLLISDMVINLSSGEVTGDKATRGNFSVWEKRSLLGSYIRK